MRIEDLVMVTEEGCEVLNSYPKELSLVVVIPAAVLDFVKLKSTFHKDRAGSGVCIRRIVVFTYAFSGFFESLE